MDKTTNCVRHKSQLNELYCKGCKQYLCPECVTDHGVDGHKPSYCHVSQYAQIYALPKVDQLFKDISGKDSDINYEASEFVASVQGVIPMIQDTIQAHIESAEFLKKQVHQLKQFMVAPTKPKPYTELMRNGLTQDKKALENAIKGKNTKEVLRLTQKIEAEAMATSSGPDETKKMIAALQAGLIPLANRNLYKGIIEATQRLLYKCQHLRLNEGYSSENWKIDRKYLSSKASLSEDGLTYGNTASSGYPGIIGDTPFDCGLYAFEVIPKSLDCTGKEGFGIIEYDKWKSGKALLRSFMWEEKKSNW